MARRQVKVASATVRWYDAAMVTKASASIGRRLFVARTKRELTMAELGNKADLSASGVNHIEKGRSSPTAETVEGLARALGVDPCWLAYGTGVQPDWTARKSDS